MYDYFDLWSWDGTLDLIHHELYVKCREAIGREASPTAAVIDSQSVKSAWKRGASIDPPGYDAGKKIKGHANVRSTTQRFVARTMQASRQRLGESQPKALLFRASLQIRLMLRKLCNPARSLRTDS